MIELFRSFSKSWVARGFFLLLALIFLVTWGGGDWSRQLVSGHQSVASVGKSKIFAKDFYKELTRTMQQIQMSTGQTIDEEKARSLGLFEMIREKLVTQKLIELESERLGLYVSDDEVRTLVKADKLFHDEKGAFQKSRFDAILGRLGYDEASYIDVLRKDLLRQRLVEALSSATQGPLSVALPLYSWQNEKRSITSVLISTDDVVLDKMATEDDLKKFYDEQKAKLTAPEYRHISLLILEQNKLMDAVMIPKSDLEASYSHRDEEFKGKTFDTVKKQIEIDLKRSRTAEAFEKLINQAEDLLGQGKSMEEVAKELDLGIMRYEHIDKEGNNDPFVTTVPTSVEQVDLKAVQEAFTLDLEGHSAPVDVAPGRYRIARVDKIEAQRTRTFEEVKKKLIDFWVMSKKLETLKVKADEIARDMNQQTPAAVVASKNKLKLIGGKIARSGPVAPSVLELSPQVVERLYGVSVGEAVSVPYKLDDKKGVYAVIQVLGKERPDAKSKIEEVHQFQDKLKTMFVDDLMSLYLYALRKRFPVEVNHHFFAKTKPSQENARDSDS